MLAKKNSSNKFSNNQDPVTTPESNQPLLSSLQYAGSLLLATKNKAFQ